VAATLDTPAAAAQLGGELAHQEACPLVQREIESGSAAPGQMT
jgi:hypothetical protein